MIDCNHITSTDFTAAKGFTAMLADFQTRGQAVYWLNPSPDICSVLRCGIRYFSPHRENILTLFATRSVAGDSFTTITRAEDVWLGQSSLQHQPQQEEEAADSRVATYQNQGVEVQS